MVRQLIWSWTDIHEKVRYSLAIVECVRTLDYLSTTAIPEVYYINPSKLLVLEVVVMIPLYLSDDASMAICFPACRLVWVILAHLNK